MRPRYTVIALLATVSVLVSLGAVAFEPRRAFTEMENVLVLRDLRANAELGDPRAQYVVGLLYKNGQGVKADDIEAAAWFRKAAEQGHARAQFQLGAMYEQGIGVPRDDVQAYAWYMLSAVGDDPLIKESLKRVGTNLTPDQRAAADELARNWKPARKEKERSDQTAHAAPSWFARER
jgi:TPR repeat protein